MFIQVSLGDTSVPPSAGLNFFDWVIFSPPPSDFSANLSFELFMDSHLGGFISSLRQMNQIWEYAREEGWENSPAEVTLCPIISPALLYIHQSLVSYLGQLHPKVFSRPQGTRYSGTGPLCPFPLPYANSFPQNITFTSERLPRSECMVHSVSNYSLTGQTKAFYFFCFVTPNEKQHCDHCVGEGTFIP